VNGDTNTLTTIILIAGIFTKILSLVLRQNSIVALERHNTKLALKGNLTAMRLFDLGCWTTFQWKDSRAGVWLGNLWLLVLTTDLSAVLKKALTVGSSTTSWSGYLPGDTKAFGLDTGKMPGPAAFFNYSSSIQVGGDFTWSTTPIMACSSTTNNSSACLRVPMSLDGYGGGFLGLDVEATVRNVTMVSTTCATYESPIPQGWVLIVNDGYNVSTDLNSGGTSYYFSTRSRKVACRLSPARGDATLHLTSRNHIWASSLMQYQELDKVAISLTPYRTISSMSLLLSDGSAIAGAQLGSDAVELISTTGYEYVLAAVTSAAYTAERMDDVASGISVQASGTARNSAIVMNNAAALYITLILGAGAGLTIIGLAFKVLGPRLSFTPLAVIGMSATPRSYLEQVAKGGCAGGWPQDPLRSIQAYVNNEHDTGHIWMDKPALDANPQVIRKRLKYGYAVRT
jgi:hypothetical protein